MAKLQVLLKTLDDVPEALKGYYVQTGDEFVLDSDANTRVTEFRDNNIALMKERDDLKTQFAGIDPVAVQATQAELDALKAKGKGDKGGDPEFSTKLEDLERRLKDTQGKLEETDRALIQTKISDELGKAATAAKVRSDLREDVVRLAKGEWELEEGQPVRKVNGQVALSKKRPGENQNMGEYFEELLQAKPIYAEPSGGGGGQGGKGGAAAGVKIIENKPELLGQYAEQIASGEVVVDMGE